MKRLIIYIGIIIGCTSCNKYLEANFDGSVSDENVWTNPVYAEGVLLNAYVALPDNFGLEESTFLDCVTDNAVTNHYISMVYINGNGGWRADNNGTGLWYDWYQQIEYINLWIKYGQNANYYLSDALLNQQIKERLNGEARFLRAWYYWKLLQAYAGKVDGELKGVPLYNRPIENDRDYANTTKRASYEECINFILADIEKAIEWLPEEYNGNDHVVGKQQMGRATYTAAMALKTRVLLYAASPLFGVKDWSETVKASLTMMAHTRTSLPSIKWDDLESYYCAQNHNEIIMRKFDRNNTFFKDNYPPSSNGDGRTSPSQNLADTFFGKDGYPIDHPNSNYDPQHPYDNVSNRFKATIAYNGSGYRNQKLETFVGGFDTEAQYVNATRTGMYLRKWMSMRASADGIDETVGLHYYALFRYAEIFLNFAEAANEWVGPDVPVEFGGVSMSAKDAIKEVRKRAGLTNHDYLNEVAAQGQDAFRTLIKKERRIELCFEGHYFWDLRRWNDALNNEVKGVKIQKLGEDEFTYEYPVIERRNFDEYMRFGPIPFNQVALGLRQNDGW
ncbi:RagB/SusD family nutrient uptake outer membrane protein [Flammeovirga yaeyamensis]|uniref:RagB/SusD family nutrient uptake outer membrane protein n=1 Tax=Flammeovirga yaeyamensis TaxID=367791 RepID=A0AAX1NC58_9BACT|nr:RagB/SusD family nutrient uptake outer membrane protein [Flammeovirga yaeyamensis]MBB3696893.1 hypothetical protein [Flammeovirga yaeyamensis]NMF33557.1 RagB/SusD family nutrient uptake outer membrane protein [Flammeovirga yaeyamensis]QWG05174.1 RagB/SusD family nutrient uptake outer membrane protein [Flammeovirga yaeyamensis]